MLQDTKNPLIIIVDYDPSSECPWHVESSREVAEKKTTKPGLNPRHGYYQYVQNAMARIHVLLKALKTVSDSKSGKPKPEESPIYPEIRDGQVYCSGECAHQDVCRYSAILSGQPCPPAEEYLRSRKEEEKVTSKEEATTLLKSRGEIKKEANRFWKLFLDEARSNEMRSRSYEAWRALWWVIDSSPSSFGQPEKES